MKKPKIVWGRVLTTTLLLILILFAVLLYLKVDEFNNQLMYLQDTTKVILSDVSGLEDGIAKTLQKETGRIEDYSIEFMGIDLAAKTYDVAIQLVPKEYTDNTKVSVYFGTLECKLEKENYVYSGVMSLPLDNSFHGNLTFLFTDGKKKNTEIYSDYKGIQTRLEQVLTASLPGEISIKDGELAIDGTLSIALDGVNLYEFDSLELVMELGEDEISVHEYEDVLHGLQREERLEIRQPIDIDAEATDVRLLLKAFTTRGYRFEYPLMTARIKELVREDDNDHEPTDEETERLFEIDEPSVSWEADPVVYDAKGGKMFLKELLLN